MATCVVVVEGVLQVAEVQPASMADCPGLVVMSAPEFVAVSIVPTFSQVFAIPATADLAAMWMGGSASSLVGPVVTILNISAVTSRSMMGRVMMRRRTISAALSLPRGSFGGAFRWRPF